MEFSFYSCAFIAILAVLRVVTSTNVVRALLYFLISLLAMSGIFFSLGAYFAGALEVIIYAGAIMVLFVFVVMMLNLGKVEENQEKAWLSPKLWIGPGILSAILLAVVVFALLGQSSQIMEGEVIGVKDVGLSLFGEYLFVVELASMLLLAGMVVAFHLGRDNLLGKDDGTKVEMEERV
ncbi:NADH-quinone oxidoreductase subunit J [Acetobacteraceae bacterium]|nr:NADH-quinone oxidoreductase subunit J [Acetobacteraceae bacterium]